MMYLHYLTDPSLCRNVFTLWECALLRGPVVVFIPFASFLHLATFLERFIASKNQHDYEKFGNTIGYCFSGVAVS